MTEENEKKDKKEEEPEKEKNERKKKNTIYYCYNLPTVLQTDKNVNSMPL